MKVYLYANKDSYMNLLLIHICDFMLGLQLEWSSVGQSDVNNCACYNIFKKKIFKFPTAWAPSVFGAVWFCRWVVTHSLCGFQLPWPPSCCLHHTEHPFAFIGRLEQIRLSPAYLENVRLNPSSPVLLTRNGPLRIIDTIVIFTE
jgi:hypothetical protein